MAESQSSYEGRQSHIPALKTPPIETWEFMYPGTDTVLEVRIPAFTCICPKTGLPDFATLVITYVPDRLCLELKSLKEYILFYRDVGIFHETYRVGPGTAESLYANLPPFGMGQAVGQAPVATRGQSAGRRMGTSQRDEPAIAPY